MRRQAAILILCALVSVPATAGWRDFMDKVLQRDSSGQKRGGDGRRGFNLSPSEVSGGLKQALDKGIRYAIHYLGQENGFYGSQRFRIPLPGKLRRVRKTLVRVGMKRYVDDFELTMNRAAESAVRRVKRIFIRAIRQMTLKDAIAILRGPDNAATMYFRRVTEHDLVARMMPIMRRATASTGVTRAYKRMIGKLGPVRRWIRLPQMDLDEYITRRAIDALFVMIAEEERAIRRNPVKRTTRLLRRVFGF